MIFDTDSSTDSLDKSVCVSSLFHKFFLGNTLSVIYIGSREFCNFSKDIQREFNQYVRYFDLSQCREGDYQLLCRAIADGAEGIILDRIDQIPHIADRDQIEQLVISAMKRDYQPFEGGERDFSQIRVGASCQEMPEYLRGKSLQALFITPEIAQDFYKDN